MTIRELKGINEDFREIASRLINAQGVEADRLLENFVYYIEHTSVISDYIESLKPIASTVDAIWGAPDEVSSFSLGVSLNLGKTRKEEAINLYLVLRDILDSKYLIHQVALHLDRTDTHISALTKVFGQRLIKPLASTIEQHIRSLIEDEIEALPTEGNKSGISFSGNINQLNLAQDNSSIMAKQNNQKIPVELIATINELRAHLTTFANKDLATEIAECLNTIQAETQKEAPKASVLEERRIDIEEILPKVESSSTIACNLAQLSSFLSKFITFL